MKALIEIDQDQLKVDLSKPLDISIPVSNKNSVNAWYVGQTIIKPQQLGDWEGSIEKGASVNFNNIQFNPHSHGTHTESVAHILPNSLSINETLNTYFFKATLITIIPIQTGKDHQITLELLEKALDNSSIGKALIVRTTPNTNDKKRKNYSDTNWTYFTKEAMQFIVNMGIMHILVDTPSVDKEKDNGKLEAHHTFWQTSSNLRVSATITEFVYVPNEIIDGNYLLNLQVAAFENNAAPSRPILFEAFPI